MNAKKPHPLWTDPRYPRLNRIHAGLAQTQESLQAARDRYEAKAAEKRTEIAAHEAEQAAAAAATAGPAPAPRPGGGAHSGNATKAVTQKHMGYGEIALHATAALLTGGLSLIWTASKRRKNRSTTRFY
ncbi:hypothetical protein ACMATS_05905 [Streptoverticillium reticulum]|uniref:hypothetical protein n=1 Tax=Streptoverticillium reticulum TaxID=1433415 RepID=UPI0039BFCA9B